jgi:hypothetical protein
MDGATAAPAEKSAGVKEGGVSEPSGDACDDGEWLGYEAG